MEDDTKTPEPVMKALAIIAGAVILLTQINPAAKHFGWWELSSDDMEFVQQIVGAVSAFVILVAGVFWVRRAVTPNENVALTVNEAKVLDAAAAPPVDPQDLAALANGSYPPHEGDPKP